MNRQEYMQSPSEAHHQYYLQFNNPALEGLVLHTFGLDRLKEAYATDKNLNNIPLRQWDDLFPVFQVLVDRRKTKELGEGMSLSTCVCILKNIAIHLIDRSTQPASTD